MREITAEQIEETVRELCIAANRRLPEDVKAAVNRSAEGESRPLARDILEDLRRNWETAEALSLPVCQDTGMAVVFVRLGQEAHIRGGLLADAVNRGVSRGYQEGRLRGIGVLQPEAQGVALMRHHNRGGGLQPSGQADLEGVGGVLPIRDVRRRGGSGCFGG